MDKDTVEQIVETADVVEEPVVEPEAPEQDLDFMGRLSQLKQKLDTPTEEVAEEESAEEESVEEGEPTEESEEKPAEPEKEVDEVWNEVFKAQRKLRKEQELVRSEKASIAAAKKEVEDLKNLASTDPIAFLTQYGIDPEAWIEAVAAQQNGEKPAEKTKESEELKKLQEKEQLIAQREQEAAVTSFRSQAELLVARNPEYLKVCQYYAEAGVGGQATNASPGEMALEVLREYYAEHQEVLSAEQAVEMIYEYLKPEAEKYFAAKNPAPPAPKPAPKKTLRQKHIVQAAAPSDDDGEDLDFDQRRQLAIKKLQAEMNLPE